ncbi:hypothetical protein TorRG33x02_139360 [Trema orientale]|uniref:Uncharacterized protein n=1 Tax=Trema orientale TaxID=63057 RepID=A0A2P5EXM8_TREOI|nr:hypothetical protein TorRG33x02_139360 [Trema orientale]
MRRYFAVGYFLVTCWSFNKGTCLVSTWYDLRSGLFFLLANLAALLPSIFPPSLVRLSLRSGT